MPPPCHLTCARIVVIIIRVMVESGNPKFRSRSSHVFVAIEVHAVSVMIHCGTATVRRVYHCDTSADRLHPELTLASTVRQCFYIAAVPLQSGRASIVRQERGFGGGVMHGRNRMTIDP